MMAPQTQSQRANGAGSTFQSQCKRPRFNAVGTAAGRRVEPVVTMPQEEDFQHVARKQVMRYSRPSRMRPSGICQVVRGLKDLERRAQEAGRRPEPQVEPGARRPMAHTHLKDSVAKGRKRSSGASAEASAKKSKASAAARAAEAEVESIQRLLRRKELLAAAQQDHLEPLLALEEGADEQAQELVSSLLQVLADRDLEFVCGGPGKPAKLAQLLAQLLAWDPPARSVTSGRRLWRQLQDALSKVEADVEEKLSRARRSREMPAAAPVRDLARPRARASTAKKQGARADASAGAEAVKPGNRSNGCDEACIVVRAVKHEM